MKGARPLGDRQRGSGGVTHCYGCLCETCANSVELSMEYFTVGEAAEPCFNCDECRYYDGSSGKSCRWNGTCSRYIEAQKAFEARAREVERKAKAIRATFRIIKGGSHETL